MTDRELMQMALDALDWKLTTLLKKSWENHHIHEVVKALRYRLAQPEPEPVAWLAYKDGFQEAYITSNPLGYTDEYKTLPLWAHPPEWVGLTDEEIDVAVKSCNTVDTYKYFRAIEAKLKEKNT
jgi:hypothetical protein